MHMHQLMYMQVPMQQLAVALPFQDCCHIATAIELLPTALLLDLDGQCRTNYTRSCCCQLLLPLC